MDAATTLPAGAAELTLGLLNVATQAWVEQEYHRAKHFNPFKLMALKLQLVYGVPDAVDSATLCRRVRDIIIYNAMARLMLGQA